MRWTEELTLVQVTYELDALKQEIPKEVPRVVRANPWRVSFEEKVRAGVDMMHGVLRFEIQTVMYRGEQVAEYKGKRYRVDCDVKGFRSVLTLTEVPSAEN